MRIENLQTDVLIIGGGTAGCYAALTISEHSDAKVLICEKAHIKRSGCLAAGVNALNAYIVEGRTPQDYVDYARKDADGIVRGDLLLTMSERLNSVTERLEKLGLVILKDKEGKYVTRGNRNLKINGENIKPILADAVNELDNVTVLNRVNIIDYAVENNHINGAFGIGIENDTFYVIKAKAVIIATGGAAGLYKPNNPGFSRHKMWYPPFNTGAGFAMGINAGAEMTTFEMRFIALRCKDTIAYLNMAPSQTIKWIESGKNPSQQNVEIEGTEPYIVGGHTASGYWVDTNRKTTIDGLYAAGDVAGGCPQKYVTGALAEGEIAALSVVEYIKDKNVATIDDKVVNNHIDEVENFLKDKHCKFTTEQLEEAMQTVMDSYAGGIKTNYRFNEKQLEIADYKIKQLMELSKDLYAEDFQELMYIYELRERLTVCRSVIAHLKARKETRWHSFAENLDYPEKDNEHWNKYVNSILEDGEIKIITRELVEEGTNYEHFN